MSERFEYEQLATALAHMARDLLSQRSVQDTLNRIAEYSVELIEGCEDAGVLMLRRGRHVETLSATSDRVRKADRAQHEQGEGPCFDATKGAEQIYRIADMGESQDRWPQFAPRARDLGIGSMLGFLLFTDRDNLGALDLYSSRPNAFTERSEQPGWILAAHAAIAFSSARTEADLSTAVETRQVIGEALGIVMERYKMTENQAFEVIKKSSQDHNIKLRDIARRVTETGEIPGTGEQEQD